MHSHNVWLQEVLHAVSFLTLLHAGTSNVSMSTKRHRDGIYIYIILAITNHDYDIQCTQNIHVELVLQLLMYARPFTSISKLRIRWMVTSGA